MFKMRSSSSVKLFRQDTLKGGMDNSGTLSSSSTTAKTLNLIGEDQEIDLISAAQNLNGCDDSEEAKENTRGTLVMTQAPFWDVENNEKHSSVKRLAWSAASKPGEMRKQNALSDVWQSQAGYITNRRSFSSMSAEYRAQEEERRALPPAVVRTVMSNSIVGYKHKIVDEPTEDRFVVDLEVVPTLDVALQEELGVLSVDQTPFALFGVFDGHGGATCADFLANNIASVMAGDPVLYDEGLAPFLKRAVATTNTFETLEKVHCEWAQDSGDLSGSTAILGTFVGGMLVMAGIGDSAGLFVDHNGALKVLCPRHTTDNPQEVKRVLEMGGKIINGRVGGVLMPTRSLGDLDVKQQWGEAVVSPVPEMAFARVVSSADPKKRFATAPFLVLASDGLWDVLSYEEVAGMARKSLKAKDKYPGRDTADELVRAAVQLGSKDDITVLVVVFE